MYEKDEQPIEHGRRLSRSQDPSTRRMLDSRLLNPMGYEAKEMQVELLS